MSVTDAYFALPEPVRDAIHAAARDLSPTSAADASGPNVRADLVSAQSAPQASISAPAITFDDYNAFSDALARIARKRGLRLTATLKKQVQAAITVRDESAQPVIKKRTGDHIDYEPDPDLRDTEQIPLTETVDAFMQREVLPYAPDAWIADGSEKIGYEISFTRYFYKPQQLRTLAEIEADIRALERETDGLLEEILAGVADA